MREVYEVNQDIRAMLDAAFVDEDGEYIIDTDALAELYRERDAAEEREATLLDMALYYKNLKAEADMMKEEKLALGKRQSGLEWRAERVFDELKRELNGKGLTDPRVKVSWRKTQRVEVTEMGHIPDECLRVKIEPDKAELKKVLKAGAEIPGVTLVDDVSMSIR